MKGDVVVCAAPYCDNEFVQTQWNHYACSNKCGAWIRNRRRNKDFGYTNCANPKCGKEIKKSREDHQYCNMECIYERREYERHQKYIYKICPVCGEKFWRRQERQETCSKKCNKEFRKAKYDDPNTRCCMDDCLNKKWDDTEHCYIHRDFTPEKIAEKEAELRKRGYEPLVPYPGQDNQWLVRHSCGSEHGIRISHVMTHVDDKCRDCGSWILDPNKPLVLYLGYMEHGTEKEKGKIGLSCDLERRVGQHKKDFEDFDVVDVICFDDGFLAVEIEKQLKLFLKENRTVPYKREFFYTTDWKPKDLKEFLEIAGVEL